MGSGRRARSQLAALGAVTTWVICRVRLVISVHSEARLELWQSRFQKPLAQGGATASFPQIVALRRRELLGRPEAKDFILNRAYLLPLHSAQSQTSQSVEGRASPDLQRSNSCAVRNAFLFSSSKDGHRRASLLVSWLFAIVLKWYK